jgi:hypothetical protein
LALRTPLLLAVLARRSCSRIVSSLVASLLPCCPASFPASAFLLAVLARRSCSPFLLAVLARRSCSPVLLAGLARRSCSRWIFQLRVGRARHRHHHTFVKLVSSASTPESFPAPLASSPASSPALSPASCLVALPRLSHRSQARRAADRPLFFVSSVIHGALLPPPSPWLPPPAPTAALFYCGQPRAGERQGS